MQIAVMPSTGIRVYIMSSAPSEKARHSRCYILACNGSVTTLVQRLKHAAVEQRPVVPSLGPIGTVFCRSLNRKGARVAKKRTGIRLSGLGR